VADGRGKIRIDRTQAEGKHGDLCGPARKDAVLQAHTS